MKDIVIAGIAGSGKGTQCKKLLDKYGKSIKYFEAGGLLRVLQSSDNPVGNYIGSVIDKGGILKDEFMIKIFELFLATVEGNERLLIDGFPRQIRQMHLFLDRMNHAKRDIVVIVLDVSEDESHKRLPERRICKKCGEIFNLHVHEDMEKCLSCGGELYQRVDDKDKESIETRIRIYEDVTKPVIAYLEGLGLVKRINGEQSIEKVFQDIEQAIS